MKWYLAVWRSLGGAEGCTGREELLADLISSGDRASRRRTEPSSGCNDKLITCLRTSCSAPKTAHSIRGTTHAAVRRLRTFTDCCSDGAQPRKPRSVYLRIGIPETCKGWGDVWFLRGKRPEGTLRDRGCKLSRMEAGGEASESG